jgi:hypothetical protein
MNINKKKVSEEGPSPSPDWKFLSNNRIFENKETKNKVEEETIEETKNDLEVEM